MFALARALCVGFELEKKHSAAHMRITVSTFDDTVVSVEVRSRCQRR